MSSRSLEVVLAGRPVGTLAQTMGGQHTFSYGDDVVTPLSVSMPARTEPYDHRVVEPWLSGLLPDNYSVRARWGTEFGVSGENPFALLEHMGLDCPGAVQFFPPGTYRSKDLPGHLESVDEYAIAERLRALRAHEDTWTIEDEHWSLAGAQSKFAIARVGGGWAEAKGSAATTHIVKPGVSRLRLQALNEHVCMRVAGSLGLQVAPTEYVEFDGEAAIVISRYDRRVEGEAIRRIHQEDFCQAMSIRPGRKYEVDGGPTVESSVELLRRHVVRRVLEVNIDRFIDAIVYSFLIGAPDAHGKNYSLLLIGNQVRLAPLYDIASGLPYDRGPAGSGMRRLAMAIAGEKHIDRVAGRHWDALASIVGLDPAGLRARVVELAVVLPDAMSDEIADVPLAAREELRTRLLDRVSAHCLRVRERLARWEELTSKAL